MTPQPATKNRPKHTAAGSHAAATNPRLKWEMDGNGISPMGVIKFNLWNSEHSYKKNNSIGESSMVL